MSGPSFGLLLRTASIFIGYFTFLYFLPNPKKRRKKEWRIDHDTSSLRVSSRSSRTTIVFLTSISSFSSSSCRSSKRECFNYCFLGILSSSTAAFPTARAYLIHVTMPLLLPKAYLWRGPTSRPQRCLLPGWVRVHYALKEEIFASGMRAMTLHRQLPFLLKCKQDKPSKE
jgi:hypothetical protein